MRISSQALLIGVSLGKARRMFCRQVRKQLKWSKAGQPP